MGNNLAAVHAGAGTHVDDVIGRSNRLLIMFHNKNGVSKIAQALERLEQAGVVPLMQADGRLVENIEDTGQARTDL